jgi:cytochrome bd-type quinol oxidase subunit 2
MAVPVATVVPGAQGGIDVSWLVEAHSGLRWLVVVAGVAAVIVPLLAIASPSRLLRWVRSTVALYAILVTVQVLIGVVLWISQGRWDSANVFLSWIHPVAMLVGTGLAHAGLARARRGEGAEVARAGAVFSVLSLVVITAAVPTASWGM